MSLLTLTTSQDQQAVRVRLDGELDLSSALTFDDELRRIEADGANKRLVLDLKGLKFMDSTGLRLILAAHARARRRGSRLVIEHASNAIRRIFRLTGMMDRLDVTDERTTKA
jgi:anti-anti-sigma factor